jgi:hypothetical protein
VRKALPIITVIWVAAMLLSLRYGFLNRFVTGAAEQALGFDFFQMPAGFGNLVSGSNIFLTELRDYPAPRAPYFNHPLLSVLVGPWTEPFPPYVAYGLFVAFSVTLLFVSARLLASVFNDPACKAFAYFACFCSLPTYSMLHAGQAHIFVVASVAMILVGLMRLPQNSEPSWKWIQAGVLLSLFSKPVALLMLPVLFLLPETRRKMLVPVEAYAVVSLLFLLVPRLNPGWYNATHWVNLTHASLTPLHIFWLVIPAENCYTDNTLIYSLPRLLYGHCSQFWMFSAVAVLVGIVLAASVLTTVLSDQVCRVKVAVCTIVLCVFSHYLCYFMAYEYPYAALSPTLPALLWLRNCEENRRARWFLTTALLAASCIFLPTLQVFTTGYRACWLSSALLRVAPVVIAFTSLSAYVTITAWSHARVNLVKYVQQAQEQLATRPVIAGGVLLLTVFMVAYATVPNRLLAHVDSWRDEDWVEHCEDMLHQPDVGRAAKFCLHRQLAIKYAEIDEAKALQHYREANGRTIRHNTLAVEMAGVFLSVHKRESAGRLLATLKPQEIKEPQVRKRYYELKRTLASGSD